MHKATLRGSFIGLFSAVVASMLVTGCTATEAGEQQDTRTYLERTVDATRETVRCLTVRGWPVSYAGPGQFGATGIPVEQAAAWDADRRDCIQQHMADLQAPETTANQANAYFDALEETAACLVELGFPISDPPSRARLVDAALRDDLSLWNPFVEAMLSGVQHPALTWDEIRDTCNSREFIEFTS